MSSKSYTDYYLNQSGNGFNEYSNYYVNQAGSGIPGFQGARIQRGQGFFGTAYKSVLLPLLKYLGPKVFKTGVNVAEDAIAGENILSSLKKRGKATLSDIIGETSGRKMNTNQTGKGRRSRRKRKSYKVQFGSGYKKRNNSQIKRRSKRKGKKRSKKSSSIFY